MRIERLKRTSALDAVIKPLEKTPVTYAPGVAEKIVEDLLTIRSSSGGEAIGEFANRFTYSCLSSYVESTPCRYNGNHQNFAEQYGNVSQALSQIYEECLTTLIQEAKVEESVLRDWFENKLITPDRKRDRIREEDTTTGDLPNIVVRRLATLHILRAETRGTVRWYELTHDRLIEPILRSNEFSKLLSQQARLQQTAEAANLLLTKDSLSELVTY